MSDSHVSTLPAQLDPRDREYIESLTNAEERETIVSAIIRYQRADRLDEGDTVPALELFRTDGSAVPLRDLVTERPLVLVFGSYT